MKNTKSKLSTLNSKFSQGFTLIELLVVIAILGILATIAMISISGAQKSARDSQRKSDLADIRSALEIYRADCGSYPTSAQLVFGGTLVGTGAVNCLGTTTYMSKVPQDPQLNRGGLTYVYIAGPVAGCTGTSCTTYSLCSYLEHPGTASGGQCGATTCGTGGQACYYKLVSP